MGAEEQEQQSRQPPGETPEAAQARTALVERLFREHNEALLRFLAARLRSRQAASEVAQEAYVRLLNLDKPGAIGYFQSLLFRTAANLATDRLRREEKFQHITALPLFREFADTRTPERNVAGAETVQRLERLIGGLPEKCRRAFLLNRVEGKDFDAIAREMGLSERMVRTYVVKALLHCRTRLDLEPADE